jgi:hypothetical protein
LFCNHKLIKKSYITEKNLPTLLTNKYIIYNNVYKTAGFPHPARAPLAVDKKTFYQEDLKEAPFVLPNKAIQLYPGETVFIQVEQIDGAIKTIKAVKEITDSANTLTISFNQITNGKEHQQMMLKVTNPLPYQLSYKAIIFLMQNKKWVPTEVYPVRAGLSGFESWPEIITSISIGKFVLSK